MKQDKHKLQRILLVLVLTMAMYSIVAPIHAQAAVKINKSPVTLCRYHQYQLKITGAKQKVKWKSSNKVIASVNSKGLVTAKEAGSAKITAVVGKKTVASCKVTVKSYARQEELAAYGYNAIQKIFTKNANIKMSNAKYSTYMDGREFSYFKVTYTDKNDKSRTAYVSVYANENESSLELNAPTKLYGNLIVEISGGKMEQMMEDRSTAMKSSTVTKIAGLLKKTESVKTKKGAMFSQKHEWMDL